MTTPTQEIPAMKTLSSIMAQLKNEGYKEEFKVENAYLVDTNSAEKFAPEEIKIDNYYRFEGESDPSDSSILYAISTTINTKKGTLLNAYGAYADSDIDKFIRQVESIEKQV